MDKLHYTTDLYHRAFKYASGLSTDAGIFTGAIYQMMKNRIWESGWIDQVSGETVSAPSLKEFIERHVPKGIGQNIVWTYATLKSAHDLRDECAGEAIKLLDKQIKETEGETAEAIYRRAVVLARDAADQDNQRPSGRPSSETLYNIQDNKAPTGTSIEAALRRLRNDDRPLAKELHAKVKDGEMSAHAAAIQAGYRKKPKPRLTHCPHCGGEL